MEQLSHKYLDRLADLWIIHLDYLNVQKLIED